MLYWDIYQFAHHHGTFPTVNRGFIIQSTILAIFLWFHDAFFFLEWTSKTTGGFLVFHYQRACHTTVHYAPVRPFRAGCHSSTPLSEWHLWPCHPIVSYNAPSLYSSFTSFMPWGLLEPHLRTSLAWVREKKRLEAWKPVARIIHILHSVFWLWGILNNTFPKFPLLEALMLFCRWIISMSWQYLLDVVLEFLQKGLIKMPSFGPRWLGKLLFLFIFVCHKDDKLAFHSMHICITFFMCLLYLSRIENNSNDKSKKWE